MARSPECVVDFSLLNLTFGKCVSTEGFHSKNALSDNQIFLIQGDQRINPNDFGDPLMFHQVPAGQSVH